MSDNPRILFVAMTESIHTSRWINQLNESGFDVHVFPSNPNGYNINTELKCVSIHGLFVKPKYSMQGLKFYNTFPWPFKGSHVLLNRIITYLYKIFYKIKNDFDFRSFLLRITIKTIKPDIIHILEMQHSGYLVADAIRNIECKDIPKLIYTPWGSDIHYFGGMEEHASKIISLLAKCNYYWPKSQRDIKLAMEFGFKGQILPVLPGNGGYRTEVLRALWSPGLTSDRKVIMVKGHHGWVGRALNALKAIGLCSDLLSEYRIIVYSPAVEVESKARDMMDSLRLKIEMVKLISHEEMMRMYGRSRFSIGASISDGVPNSLLESMVMGCLPIESVGGCANEFIRDGYNGFIIDAENVENIAGAIKKALTDDDLVNKAAEINFQTIKENYEYSDIKAKVIKIYKDILTN